jgi:hypothetical protein
MLDNQRIAEIQTRLNKATMGPWRRVVIGPDDNALQVIRGGFVAACGQDDNSDHYVLPSSRVEWKPAGSGHDADFIAHAPTDIAYLLAERSRLAGENAELRQPPTDPRALYVQLRDAIAALQSENAELRKDAERWQYFRRFLSVERDRYTPTQYVVADVNLIVETTVREGVNHTVELLVDVARFSAGATGDRE